MRTALLACLIIAHAAAAHAAFGFTQPTDLAVITMLPITIGGSQTGAASVSLSIEQDPGALPPPAGTGGATTTVDAQLGATTWQVGPLNLLNGTYRLTVSSNVDLPVSITVTVNVPGNPGLLGCTSGAGGLQAQVLDWAPAGPSAPALNVNFWRSATAFGPELLADPTFYPTGTSFTCVQNTNGRVPRVLIMGGDPVIDLANGVAGWSFAGGTLTAKMNTVSGALPQPPPFGTVVNSMIAGLFALYDDDPGMPGTLPQLTGTYLAANAAFTFTPIFAGGQIVSLQLTLDGPTGQTAFFEAYFPAAVVNTFFGGTCSGIPLPVVMPSTALVTGPTIAPVGTLGCEVSLQAQFQSPVSITLPFDSQTSPTDVVAQLVAATTQLGFRQAVNLLQNALRDLERNRPATACNRLGAFLNQVRAQTGRRLTAVDAGMLTQLADTARSGLGCAP